MTPDKAAMLVKRVADGDLHLTADCDREAYTVDFLEEVTRDG